MVSSWILVVLGVCSLVGVHAQISLTPTDDDAILNPQQATKSDEGLLFLVLQLKARVEQLEKEREDRARAQVAFSASLLNTWTDVGPFDTDTTLLFEKVTTNVGDAYNKHTGIFTAPVKGLYYFRFTGSVGNSGTLDATLIQNGVGKFEIYNTLGAHSSGSNGMTLVLEEGDHVWITLWKGNTIFDQSRLTTFSGFLVFPM